MSNAVARLQSGLDEVFCAHLPGMWDDVQAMTQALDQVQRQHDSAAGKAVSADKIGAAAHAGLAVLRDWLAQRWIALDAKEGTQKKPRWFATLSLHANLLGTRPCDRYGPPLLRGDAEELQAAVDGLAIPGDSWVKEEAILAQLRAADAHADDEWLRVLPQMLEVATGKAGIEVSAALSRRCVAMLVLRYARCESVDMHAGLLDAALAAIGNPWLRRSTWDAYVLEENGSPGDHAREMVNNWLKHLLIGNFFRLHSGDGDRDGRRTAYWQRYDPFIQSLWVGLAPQSLEKPGVEYEMFRRRARGALLVFDDLAADDNAIVMRIGDHLAVEFGGKGRPLYLFAWSNLDPGLARRLASDRDKRYFNIADLMQTPAAVQLEHRDGTAADAKWEHRFDQHLRPLVMQSQGALRQRRQ